MKLELVDYILDTPSDRLTSLYVNEETNDLYLNEWVDQHENGDNIFILVPVMKEPLIDFLNGNLRHYDLIKMWLGKLACYTYKNEDFTTLSEVTDLDDSLLPDKDVFLDNKFTYNLTKLKDYLKSY